MAGFFRIAWRSFAFLSLFLTFAVPVLAVDPDGHEPNDSKDKATVINGLKNGEWRELAANFHSASDHDWFKLEIPAKGTLRVEAGFASGPVDVIARLFDAESNEITAENRYPLAVLTAGNVAAGTYYLEITAIGATAAPWKLRVNSVDPKTFPGWLMDNGYEPDTAFDFDPNKDGISLGAEYGLGREANANPAEWGAPVSVPQNCGLGMCAYVSTPFTGTRLPVSVEMSTDGRTWTPVPADNITDADSNRIPAGSNADLDLFFHHTERSTRLFLRVKIERPQ